MRFRRREGGATLVEGAFALPIFFLLFLGLIDFGLFGLKSNQASNAARDGARVGAVHYLQADQVGSADHDRIRDTIVNNLPGRSIPGDTTLEVECVEPDGDPTTCATARLDIDRIRVRVSWDHEFISPVARGLGFDSATVDGESAMVIIGAPTGGGGPAPDPCDVTGASATPNPVRRTAGGALESDLTINVAGTGSCGNLTVSIVPPGGSSIEVCTGPSCLNPITHTATSDTVWTSSGTAVINVTGDDTTSGSFVVDDPTPPPCDVTGVTVTPSTVERTASGHLAENLSVNVQGSGACTGLLVTLTDVTGDVATVCSGSCLGTWGYLATQDAFWDAGAATAEVSGEDTASSSFTVTAATTTCSVGVSTEPTQVQATSSDKDLDDPASVRIILAVAGPCSNFTVTVTASDGSTSYQVCTGACLGPFDWNPPAAPGAAKPWINGDATVTVTGDATASTTFEVLS